MSTEQLNQLRDEALKALVELSVHEGGFHSGHTVVEERIRALHRACRASGSSVNAPLDRRSFEAHFGSALDYRPWPKNTLESTWIYDCTRTEYAWRGWRAAMESYSSMPLAKYDEVLLPFLEFMRHELFANSGKGDRDGWLTMTPGEALLDVYDHVAKLNRAVAFGQTDRIREHAADTAIVAMMVVDICGCLTSGGNPQNLEAEHTGTLEALRELHRVCIESDAERPDSNGVNPGEYDAAMAAAEAVLAAAPKA